MTTEERDRLVEEIARRVLAEENPSPDRKAWAEQVLKKETK